MALLPRLSLERYCETEHYQPVDEVLNWSSTHNIWRTKLRATALRSRSIAEQGLRQRAVMLSMSTTAWLLRLLTILADIPRIVHPSAGPREGFRPPDRSRRPSSAPFTL